MGGGDRTETRGQRETTGHEGEWTMRAKEQQGDMRGTREGEIREEKGNKII